MRSSLPQSGGKSGTVFNIQRFSIHDGPGVRTTVFLKGCPLHCAWCSNPESINLAPELGVIRDCCNNCGKCLEACPENAISINGDKAVHIDRGRCTACGKCATVCFPGALSVYGKEMSVDEVLKEVGRDRIFYQNSGGGVTASGGEPLAQFEFVTNLFQACREAGIHTCLQTSGYAGSDALGKVLALTDYLFYDIKAMDSEVHRRYCGQPNELILANARLAADTGIPIRVRIPLVPGVNDSLANIRQTAHFVKDLRNDIAIEMLPYHRMGKGKYLALDKDYSLDEVQPPEPAHLEPLRKAIEEAGLESIR